MEEKQRGQRNESLGEKQTFSSLDPTFSIHWLEFLHALSTSASFDTMVIIFLFYIDDLLLSSTSSTMTSPIKLENPPNRQHSQQQQHHHGAMGKNLHLSEVITTAAATNTHHCNGMGTHRHHMVDPIEMTKLLSNITTSTNSSSKVIPMSSTMDHSSRVKNF